MLDILPAIGFIELAQLIEDVFMSQERTQNKGQEGNGSEISFWKGTITI